MKTLKQHLKEEQDGSILYMVSAHYIESNYNVGVFSSLNKIQEYLDKVYMPYYELRFTTIDNKGCYLFELKTEFNRTLTFYVDEITIDNPIIGAI
jgi:hypothetical protein